jgi:hypothetical protein
MAFVRDISETYGMSCALIILYLPVFTLIISIALVRKHYTKDDDSVNKTNTLKSNRSLIKPKL